MMNSQSSRSGGSIVESWNWLSRQPMARSHSTTPLVYALPNREVPHERRGHGLAWRGRLWCEASCGRRVRGRGWKNSCFIVMMLNDLLVF